MLQDLLGSVRAVAVQPILGFQLGTRCYSKASELIALLLKA